VRVAVIGATGVVGGTILRVLDERSVPIDALLAYASRERPEGVAFRGATVPVAAATRERLLADRPDVAFFASSDDASAELALALVAAGTTVIDNTSSFRLADGVPLVIPEVNPHVIQAGDRLFPVANCTAIVLCVALAPIERAVGLSAVRVATYQAVSGAGRAGLDALADEERGMAPTVRLRHRSFATSCRRSAPTTATAIRVKSGRSWPKPARCSDFRTCESRRRPCACR